MFKRASLAAAVFCVAACGDSDPATSPNVDAVDGDTSADAGDSGVDTGADTGADVGVDTADDTSDDTSTDTGEDTLPDVDPTQDRDNDRLTDFDEITIWGTSPIVADTDGDGFDDGTEVLDLAFDPEVDNFQFNPLIADRPEIEIELALAPVLYATYETTTGTSETIGQERSDETRAANTRSWGGSNSYSVEQSHSVGVSVGFEGWSMTGSVSYEYSYSTTSESTSEWSEEQTTENAQTLTAMNEYEESNEISSSGGVLGVSVQVTNPGNIAYFLDNITLTAYELDPLNPENVSPVGTLTYLDDIVVFPRTRLEPGEQTAPLGFDTELDLPTLQALLADSRNLMIAPGTWLVEGDGTVDFELASTAINARTAEVIIDYGFARPTETYRISTVRNEDRNYVTVKEAFEDILRIPYAQGVASFRRTADGDPEDTLSSLTSVRDFGTSDEDATMWTIIHSYPINSGADTQTDQYHPFVDELDFEALQLQKGHTLQLVRIVDADRDGLGERAEYAYGTDPNDADTDDDECGDGFEVNGWTVGEGEDAVHYRSDPTLPNTDYDLFDDCEEYRDGTDPMSADNTPPSVGIALQEADGVAGTFRITYSDPETNVLELRYTVDGGDTEVIDVDALSGTEDLTLSFDSAGSHTISVVSFDGALLSAPAEITYNVGAASDASLIAHYPIAGGTDTTYFGSISGTRGADADADNVRFVTGRDGAGRGGVHVGIGDDGAGLVETEMINLGAEFTVSVWMRVDSIPSSMGLWGQYGSFAIGGDYNGIGLHDTRSNGYVGEGDEIIGVDLGGSWDEGDVYRLITVVVEASTVRLFVNGTQRGTASVSLGTNHCVFGFGRPSDGEFECGGMSPSEAHENRSPAAFDDIRVYNRALSANEVMAIYLD